MLTLIFFLIILNILLILNYKNLSIKLAIYDTPNTYRKIHKKPTPLFGGFIIILNLFFFLIYDFVYNNNFFYSNFKNFFLFSFIFFLLGLIDDLKERKYYYKFLYMSSAVLILIYLEPELILEKINFATFNYFFDFSSFSIFITILCFLLFINASNMFDGINIQFSIYCLFFVLVLYFKSNLNLFIPIIFSLIFFIILNFNGKIFLGDSGVSVIAFTISYFVIKSYKSNQISVEEIFLLMFLPGIDMMRLFIVRLFNKKNPFEADKNHIHHLLINFFSEKIVVLITIFISTIFYFIFILYNSFLVVILAVSFYIIFISYLYHLLKKN